MLLGSRPDNERPPNSLHIPELRPTEKQLASLLNDTDNTTVEGAVSMGGRVFIVVKTRLRL